MFFWSTLGRNRCIFRSWLWYSKLQITWLTSFSTNQPCHAVALHPMRHTLVPRQLQKHVQRGDGNGNPLNHQQGGVAHHPGGRFIVDQTFAIFICEQIFRSSTLRHKKKMLVSVRFFFMAKQAHSDKSQNQLHYTNSCFWSSCLDDLLSLDFFPFFSRLLLFYLLDLVKCAEVPEMLDPFSNKNLYGFINTQINFISHVKSSTKLKNFIPISKCPLQESRSFWGDLSLSPNIYKYYQKIILIFRNKQTLLEN